MRGFSERGPESGAESREVTPELSAWYDHSDGWPVDDTAGDGRRDPAADLGRLAVEREVTVPPETAVRAGRAAAFPDLDIEQLRREPSAREHFSDPRIGWARLDQIESTEQIRGEPFKDGTDSVAYVAEVAALYEGHAAGSTPGERDPRLTGDHRIRLCEDPRDRRPDDHQRTPPHPGSPGGGATGGRRGGGRGPASGWPGDPTAASVRGAARLGRGSGPARSPTAPRRRRTLTGRSGPAPVTAATGIRRPRSATASCTSGPTRTASSRAGRRTCLRGK